ncbi:MAG: pteridine reductase [Gammaproteobacteria bacterium]|nr:pteridine reductase [Gammaproteobacteria bacterium]
MTESDSQPVVLITGAAVRLGAACARLLHDKGCNIVIHCNRSITDANSLAETLNAQRNDSARVLQADLADTQAVLQLGEDAIAAWGRLDVLVNNASAFYPTPLENISDDQWDDLFASNAKSPLLLAHATAEALKKQKGCIINISDTHTQQGLKNHAVYIMAKSALEGLTRTLARDLAPDIRVNAIAPGAILWADQGNDHSEAIKEKIIEEISLKRMGTPEDIAQAVLFLVQQGTYMTGTVLHVDGGR